MEDIEEKIVSAGKEKANSYFQRKPAGLTPPRNMGAEADTSMPLLGRTAVRVSWDTAYAGALPIERYDVLRDGKVIGSVPHSPQITTQRFYFDDVLGDEHKDSSHKYLVRSIDASGTAADSPAMMVDARVSF